MNVEDLKVDLKKGDITYKGVCHDRGIQVTVTTKITDDGAITIDGGAVYKVKQGIEDQLYFKCDECFKNDKTLEIGGYAKRILVL